MAYQACPDAAEMVEIAQPEVLGLRGQFVYSVCIG
ncbi:hypothetical protein ATHL_01310 [Anaerolinea thermolimosa]|nr:hypothetical protein ATHL_01310 [Anaerolinea thermolimosa]